MPPVMVIIDDLPQMRRALSTVGSLLELPVPHETPVSESVRIIWEALSLAMRCPLPEIVTLDEEALDGVRMVAGWAEERAIAAGGAS